MVLKVDNFQTKRPWICIQSRERALCYLAGSVNLFTLLAGFGPFDRDFPAADFFLGNRHGYFEQAVLVARMGLVNVGASWQCHATFESAQARFLEQEVNLLLLVA